ncbi:MAG: hypothetical protein HY063_15125 [Bacteroidetes bacterium]|nr:hypothetical protein [Bacteroidota bacterium]
MFKLYEDKSHNIVDIVLFLLLIFANSWASMNFPNRIGWQHNSHDVSEFKGWALFAIFFGAVPGFLCFFFHSRGSAVTAKTWLGNFSRAVELIGIFVMAFTISVMCVLCLMCVVFMIVPAKGFDTALIFIFIAGFLSIFILPFWLIKIYLSADKSTVREINPSLRYLMLVPAIFLTSAMWNANALGIFPDSYDGTAKGWFIFAGGKVVNYLVFYSAPRMFATGKPIELNNSASWAIGSVLYFTGLSY